MTRDVVPVIGIVLAGGASRRFGSDKLAATLDGRPLLHHALAAMAAASRDLVLVLAPDAPAPDLPALASDVLITRDAAAHRGPLAGLLAGLDAAALIADNSRDATALVLGGDMPRAHPAVLRLLADELDARPDLVALSLETPAPAPLPMAIRIEARTEVAVVLRSERPSLMALLDHVPAARLREDRWRVLDPEGQTLRDVDEPSDL